jgi:hypothetical protein
MKKMLLIAMLCVGLMVSPALACDGQCVDADLNIVGQSTSVDHSYSATGWWGNYNDNAGAFAAGSSGGSLDVHANGWGFADAKGMIKSFNESDAGSFAVDFGRTSIAGAKAETNGSAFTHGSAFGPFCGRETVDSTVYVGGEVHQFNTAGETGYNSNQFVVGGNESGGSFYAKDRDFASGRFYASDMNEISGGMETKGITKVSIDPYGNNRSISAETRNMTQVNVSHGLQQSFVQGSGDVAGLSQKGGTYAGGSAGFNYTGSTYGAGNATLNANVHNGGNVSSASVNAHAQASSN